VVLLLVNLTAAKASHTISPSLIGSTKASTASLGLAFVTTLSRQKANSRFVDPSRKQLDLPIRTMATTATTSSSDDEINSEKSEKRLLLVGGGHAHIQVLKSLNWASRPDSLQITLVDLTSTPRYSGMVPATVAGLYEPNECQIQLKPLTEWSRINFIQGELIDIDFACAVDDAAGTSRRDTSNNESSQNFATVLVTKDEPVEDESDRQTIRIPFDVISLDIGSASRGIDDVPGAKDYTIPTRPISGLVDVIERTTAQLKERFQSSSSTPSREELATSSPFIDVVVVGG
jgi:NADH dehydrogenase FAD-containing subunit